MDRGNDFSDDEDDLQRQLDHIKAKELALMEKLRLKKLRSSPGRERSSQIQIPTTPPRKVPVRQEASLSPVSPARIRLNIDKGLKARDVSLGSYKQKKPSNIHSFSERLLKSGQEMKEKEEKRRELERQRVDKFSIATNIGANDKGKDKNIDEGIVEKYSKLNLSRQFLSEKVLDEQFKDKMILDIGGLFATITPPDFEPPSCPNFIVIGIIAQRSEVKVNKLNKKYMVLTLTDLKYDITLALHGEGFEKYWKIREHTVIALLNPDRYIYKSPDGNKSFGLTITSASDVILELGTSKDLGRCSALKKDGNKCNQWINISKSVYCEFHLQLGVQRAASSRMEFNSVASGMFEPKKNGQKYQYIKGGVKSKRGLQPDHFRKDVDEGRVFVAGSFFNENDYDKPLTSVSDESGKRLQKKLKAKEIENQIVRKKLAERPGGYLLKEYDNRGQIINQEETTGSSSNQSLPIFTPQQLRKLGFDPTKKSNEQQPTRDIQMSKISASQVNLRRPKKQKVYESDSDDLEII